MLHRRALLGTPAVDVAVVLISVVLVGMSLVLVIYLWDKYLHGLRQAAAASSPDVPAVDPAARTRAATELATTGRVVFRRKPDPAAVVGSLLFPGITLTVMPCLCCTWEALETTTLAFLFLGFAAHELLWLHPRSAIILTEHAFSDNRPATPWSSGHREILWEAVEAEELVPYGTGRPTFLGSRALNRFLMSRFRKLKIRDSSVRAPTSLSLLALVVRSPSTRSYRTATIRSYDVLRRMLLARAASFDITYVGPQD